MDPNDGTPPALPAFGVNLDAQQGNPVTPPQILPPLPPLPAPPNQGGGNTALPALEAPPQPHLPPPPGSGSPAALPQHPVQALPPAAWSPGSPDLGLPPEGQRAAPSLLPNGGQQQVDAAMPPVSAAGDAPGAADEAIVGQPPTPRQVMSPRTLDMQDSGLQFMGPNYTNNVAGVQLMNQGAGNNALPIGEGAGQHDRYHIGDGDVNADDEPMWEPANWTVLREQRVQREMIIPAGVMAHLTTMMARQSEEQMTNLGNNMRELAEVSVHRTHVLAEGVMELSSTNSVIMDRVTHMFNVLEQTVSQVQYLTSSERQMKADMEQGGWIDRYLTELGQRIDGQALLLRNFDERLNRINDTVRGIAVEVQASHVDQRIQNIYEDQKSRLEQWATAFAEAVRKEREADMVSLRKEIADQVEMSKNLLRQFKDRLDHQAQSQVSGSLGQEMVDRIMKLEEELQRRGKEMNRGDEIRITNVIKELRREMDQCLRNQGQDGRFQVMDSAITGLNENACIFKMQSMKLNGHSEWGSPLNHRQELILCCRVLVVRVP